MTFDPPAGHSRRGYPLARPRLSASNSTWARFRLWWVSVWFSSASSRSLGMPRSVDSLSPVVSAPSWTGNGASS